MFAVRLVAPPLLRIASSAFGAPPPPPAPFPLVARTRELVAHMSRREAAMPIRRTHFRPAREMVAAGLGLVRVLASHLNIILNELALSQVDAQASSLPPPPLPSVPELAEAKALVEQFLGRVQIEYFDSAGAGVSEPLRLLRREGNREVEAVLGLFDQGSLRQRAQTLAMYRQANSQSLADILRLSFQEAPKPLRPAAPSYVRALKRRRVGEAEEHQANDSACCSICLEPFPPSKRVVVMPCGHEFCDPGEEEGEQEGEECKGLVEWLKENNTCPVCRHELPLAGGDATQEEAPQGRGGLEEGQRPRHEPDGARAAPTPSEPSPWGVPTQQPHPHDQRDDETQGPNALIFLDPAPTTLVREEEEREEEQEEEEIEEVAMDEPNAIVSVTQAQHSPSSSRTSRPPFTFPPPPPTPLLGHATSFPTTQSVGSSKEGSNEESR